MRREIADQNDRLAADPVRAVAVVPIRDGLTLVRRRA